MSVITLSYKIEGFLKIYDPNNGETFVDKKNAINYKHALKNGLIPVITITGINIGTLIAFSIITETVFQWPGMGLLFINAVYFVDIPIMSAYMIMVAFIFVMINFIVDITYYFIDPRIRLKEEAS